MSKQKDVSAKAAQDKGMDSSSTITSGTMQRRKAHSHIRGEGYDNAIRHCIVALVHNGYFRDDIADVFEGTGIPFPSINDLRSKGLFAFDDWSDWVNADEA